MLRMRWWVYEQGWKTKQKDWWAHTHSWGINCSMTFVGALALGWSWILIHRIHHDGEEQDKCVTQSRRDVTGRVTCQPLNQPTFPHRLVRLIHHRANLAVDAEEINILCLNIKP